MLTVEGLISGWLPSPYDNDDNVLSHDAQFPHQLLKQTAGSIPSPKISAPGAPNYLPPLDTTPSLDYLDSFDHMDHTAHHDSSSVSTASSSDRRFARKRSADPDYVPRPRNAFIIFRCEYAPNHKRGSAGAPVKGTAASQKTLSGRAGEVWRNMSEAERAVYRQRAEDEKIEHALKNPDYRFQPDRKRRRAATDASTRGGCPAVARKPRLEGAGAPAPAAAAEWKVESPASILMGRRRSSSMPQPMTGPPLKFMAPRDSFLSTLSCVSSPGPQSSATPAPSHTDEDETAPCTPVDEAAPLPDSSVATPEMAPLRHPSLFQGFSFDCLNLDARSTQNSPMLPMSAAPGMFTPSEQTPTLPYQESAYTDAPYPSPLEAISSSFAEWAQDPAGEDARASFLPIPFPDAPPPASWGAEDGLALYMDALDDFAIPAGPADYDVAAEATASFDEYFHAL